ncbi:hypothetical protein RQY88_001056 [Vibrio vulnificus]|uniref:Cro/CI family transcriptional regulator n=1 Tax=Vibrio vulnificus TaxID=672 RepID=UPI0009C18A3C|nr:Cro/CI family transcriptional regulator [Vibrio vulnificus]EIJ0957765.1 hypothetical protein [Vibrio vulnificus]EIJ0962086.1 hypothetical protein [Vibrio vulnificus]EIJ0989919.1 hypothetical protein [Vibrio vulnificus]EJO2017434.1 hypothetical protein [Vibrio vulnificus]EKD8801789.1 hypothetical protein [Vibrio vulnificus]
MVTQLPPIKTNDVIAFFGSKQKVAQAVGTTHSAVSQWGEHVPESRICEFHYLMKTPEWRRSCCD